MTMGDLLLAYALVLVTMGAASTAAGAPGTRYLSAPLVALAVAIIAGVLWSFLGTALPRGVTRVTGGVLFFAALGFVVGRATRPRSPPINPRFGKTRGNDRECGGNADKVSQNSLLI